MYRPRTSLVLKQYLAANTKKKQSVYKTNDHMWACKKKSRCLTSLNLASTSHRQECKWGRVCHPLLWKWQGSLQNWTMACVWSQPVAVAQYDLHERAVLASLSQFDLFLHSLFPLNEEEPFKYSLFRKIEGAYSLFGDDFLRLFSANLLTQWGTTGCECV